MARFLVVNESSPILVDAGSEREAAEFSGRPGTLLVALAVDVVRFKVSSRQTFDAVEEPFGTLPERGS